jgi:hypothetical protein
MKNLTFALALALFLALSFPSHGLASPRAVTSITIAPGARISTLDQKAIFKLFTDFCDTFSAHDFDAHFKLYHFPIVRITGNRTTVYASIKDVPRDILMKGIPADYAKSEWTSLEIIQASPTKAHVIATFDRIRKDGTTVGNYPALYIVEKINGVWGVTVRSNFLD